MTDNICEIKQKEKTLEEYLKSLKKVAVAFSSGVDSTYLLKKAKQVLGGNVIAITAYSDIFPKRELEEAMQFCEKENIKQILIEARQLEKEEFSNNPPNRCYICKKQLFQEMKKIAKENNINELIEGSNMDDLGDYRPGLKAIEELKIKSPLRYAGLYKQEIRKLSKEIGLETWDKPSFACLASRFVYGENITKQKLKMVDMAEQFLISMGFKQIRVRIHGENMARIEVEPDDIEKITKQETKNKIIVEFKKLGFKYITVDLQGYRTGSMNEIIKDIKE